MKPGVETASPSTAHHEIMGLLLVLSSRSAPERASTVWPCGPALPFSVGRIWFCSVILSFSFSSLLLAGQKEAESASSRRCPDGVSRKKSRVFRLIFSGGPSPGGRQSRGQSLRRQGGGAFTRLPCPREQERKGGLTEQRAQS